MGCVCFQCGNGGESGRAETNDSSGHGGWQRKRTTGGFESLGTVSGTHESPSSTPFLFPNLRKNILNVWQMGGEGVFSDKRPAVTVHGARGGICGLQHTSGPAHLTSTEGL